VRVAIVAGLYCEHGMSARSPSQPALDLETIQSALRGDRVAGERLADRLKVVRRILAVINRRASVPLSSHEVEDLEQDILTIVWEKLRLFQGVGTFEAWLYRFCAYEFQNRRRREAVRTGHVKPLPEEPLSAGEAPDDEISAADLEEALRELGPPSEPVIRLKHAEGLSFEELARQLGIPPSTAKTRYYDGVVWLRQRLSRGRGGVV
jgi:RNA polymerase sigma-70 factor (ECF subfamily)